MASFWELDTETRVMLDLPPDRIRLTTVKIALLAVERFPLKPGSHSRNDRAARGSDQSQKEATARKQTVASLSTSKP